MSIFKQPGTPQHFDLKFTVMLYFLSFALILFAALAYFLQQHQRAPYGKFHTKQINSQLQDVLSKYTSQFLPQLKFIWTDKYAFRSIPSLLAWSLQEMPNLICSIFTYKIFHLPHNQLTQINKLVMLMFVFHYLNRAILYPLTLYRGSKQQTTVFICVLAFLFSCYNGFLQGLSAATVEYYPFWSFFGILAWMRVLVGLVVFCFGFWINFLSDRLLLQVQRESNPDKVPAEEKYVCQDSGKVYYIPRGGLFDFVTSANYLGELAEWAGFFLVGFSWASFSFLVWNACYLIQRAKHNHEWYVKHIQNYPSERYAIIPFVM